MSAIVKVLERRNENISGTLFIRSKHAWVIPDDVLLPNVDVRIGDETEAGNTGANRNQANEQG